MLGRVAEGPRAIRLVGWPKLVIIFGNFPLPVILHSLQTEQGIKHWSIAGHAASGVLVLDSPLASSLLQCNIILFLQS